ncbi:MAG: hypothetical protein HDS08_07550 [Bacteroides sp.]|nr:hypothetical protein [Bacteroidales bacterium]MBD5242917.1 hypothetical protein [Barnesiella sp.]MBD5315991.1 hypothetical protein [Bacteroides sp.]MDE7449128.1 FKBP-type peptidyl-prolyl cis-trans isomerase [Paramuribaculum sp.]
MKRSSLLLPLLACVVLPAVTTSCGSDDNTLDDYYTWYEQNVNWYHEMQARTNSDGTPYFTELSPSFYPKSGVLIHYFNDRTLTAGNLSPQETSTVEVCYIGHLCNDLAFDSSYLLVDSVAHFQVNGVIEGWQIALNDMHVGDSAEVIIPFLQAYGSEGSGTIPPYSYLRFNMRLDDITNYETRP